MLGLVGLVALGIALWALLDDSGGARVSAARVAALERRVDELRSQVQRTPSTAAIAGLQARERALEKQVGDLADTLQQRDAQLDQRIDALERQAATPTPSAPTPSPTP